MFTILDDPTGLVPCTSFLMEKLPITRASQPLKNNGRRHNSGPTLHSVEWTQLSLPTYMPGRKAGLWVVSRSLFLPFLSTQVPAFPSRDRSASAGHQPRRPVLGFPSCGQPILEAVLKFPSNFLCETEGWPFLLFCLPPPPPHCPVQTEKPGGVARVGH